VLEPCNAKVLRTVLRGLGASNRAWLLGSSVAVRAAHDLLRTREPPLAYSSALRTPMTASSKSPATLGLHAISGLHDGLYCAFQSEALPDASPMRA
jgi:hypothetical protein